MNTKIKTPDQRLRVFVSSTLQEMSEERIAIKEAVLSLNLIPVMFELGARPYAPRDLYTAYLQQSHVFIGIYWQSYGWIAPDMNISGLEDEFILSAKMPRLIYIKEPSTERSESLSAMIGRIQNSGVSYKTFRGTDELKQLVINDMAVLIMERFELTMNYNEVTIESDSINENYPIPPTSLIGRDKIVNELLHIIHDTNIRLVTLSGTGGMGKSRVALEVINQVKNQGNYQVCFVPLAHLDQSDKLPEVILRTAFPSANLSMPAEQLLIDLIRDRKLFLVLDNFEHLVEARLVVSILLEHCPSLKILVTSRELLHITGESEYSLPPLNINDRENLMPAADMMPSAVQLFVERARNIHPGFSVNSENYPAIRDICLTLDGIPLAIELTAARTRFYSPLQLAKMLKKDLKVLKSTMHDMPARHQTLNAAVEWSYNLLSPEEQNLLRMLSVLSEGGTLEAAAYIGNVQKCKHPLWNFPRKSFYISDDIFSIVQPETSEIEFLEAAESLLSKSLAYTSVNKFGTLRINFYQTVRHYCLEKLEESDDVHLARFKHLIYYLYLAEGNWYKMKSEQTEESYESLENDISNIESALAWASDHEPLLGLRLSIALAEYWDTRGSFRDTINWIESMMHRIPALAAQYFEISCIARYELARAYFRCEEFNKTRELIENCLSEAVEKNAPFLATDALVFKSLISVYVSLNDDKDEIILDSIKNARALNYEMALLEALQHKSADRIFSGRVEEGLPIAHETLLLAEKLKATRWEVISLIFLGFGYLLKGALSKSEKYFKRGLLLGNKVKDQILPVYSLLGLCQISIATGNLQKGGLLIGAIDIFLKKPGISIVPMMLEIYGSLMKQLSAIPAEQLSKLMVQGSKMRLGEAIELALQEEEQLQEKADGSKEGVEMIS